MPVCKSCPNHNSYHLVPVVHPSSPDSVDHLCLDCFNKEVVKTGDIHNNIVSQSKDMLDQFFRDMEAPLSHVKNSMRNLVLPYCCSCEKTLVFCQSISRVSINNKKPNEPAIPVDDQGNAMALICNDCTKLGKNPRFALYKTVETNDIMVVDVNEMSDN